MAAIERALVAGLGRVITAYQNTPLTMTDGRLVSFHRLIFGGLFRESDGAGRFRQPHEPTEFRIPVLRNDRWRMATAHGAAPESVQEELAVTFDEWNAWSAGARAARSVELANVTLHVSKLYTGILRVHPFVDGNHRAGYLSSAAALTSFALPVVEFETAEELRAHDRAVGAAADPRRGDPEPFARLLEQRLRLAHP